MRRASSCRETISSGQSTLSRPGLLVLEFPAEKARLFLRPRILASHLNCCPTGKLPIRMPDSCKRGVKLDLIQGTCRALLAYAAAPLFLSLKDATISAIQ